MGNSLGRIKAAIKCQLFPREKHSFLASLVAQCAILDVGCGNNSPLYTKLILPSCLYTGIDIGDYNQIGKDFADSYILTTPENFHTEIAKFYRSFDAVISTHNIEHCNDRDKTLKAMLGAIKVGGQLYMQFPSERSVDFPNRGGTLNYFDDPTHKDAPPNFKAMVDTIAASGFHIVYATPQYRPLLRRIEGFLNERRSRRQNRVIGGTWAYYGFEAIIWAQRWRP